jgi:hypothetical protein
MLAFVGDAKDGLLPGVVFAASVRTGIRLGVVGASIGTDVVGDVLRLFEGDESIASSIFYRFSIICASFSLEIAVELLSVEALST